MRTGYNWVYSRPKSFCKILVRVSQALHRRKPEILGLKPAAFLKEPEWEPQSREPQECTRNLVGI